MSEPDEPETESVLAGLPSTRPQRRSPKRTPTAPADPTATTSRRGTRSAAPAAARPGARASQPSSTLGGGLRHEGARLAAQGYEPDTSHGAVEPPSRADLLGSVAGGAGDLARAGLGLGRQVLRSVLGRLSGT